MTRPVTPPATAARLYVYYRVDAAALPAFAAAVRAMQQRLCREHPGLQAELLRRPAGAGEPPTLMETYAAAAGVDGALVQRVEAAARSLPAGRVGERHLERFEPFGDAG